MIRKATKFINPQLSYIKQMVFDIIWPPHSLISGQPLASSKPEEDIELWQNLQFIDEPCCYQCGFPFDFTVDKKSLCLACTARPPEYDKCRAAIVYDDVSGRLVLDLKFGGRTDGLDFFARQMLRAGRDLLARADMLIPVPLHKKRLRARRFNQSALLAAHLAKLTGLPVQTEIIKRYKHTVPQTSLSARQRRTNVKSAFKAANSKAIAGKNIVLIDDVHTTGATLSACAKTLKKSGANNVDALCLMRVVKPLESAI